MSGLDVYGGLVTAEDVEQAAIDTLKLWYPSYLREAERRTDRDPNALPDIRSYSTVNEFQKWPEEQLPVAIFISPGTTDRPKMEGDGTYRTKWILGLAIVVSARDRVATNELAKLYGAWARAALLQHQSLGGFAEGLTWEAERYDSVRQEEARTIAAANILFQVEVRRAVDERAGLAAPPSDPTADPDLPVVDPAPEVTVAYKED